MSAFPTGVITFDWMYFIQRYPELVGGGVSLSLAQLYFNEAQMYCDNSSCGPVPASAPGSDPTITVGSPRYYALHMLTAHIAALNASLNGSPSSPLVGRISEATEGTVTVRAEMEGPKSAGREWYIQTKYGAAYWQATAQYRMMMYIPGCPSPTEPWDWSLANDPQGWPGL